jgi:SAM-dependent methyltransferase
MRRKRANWQERMRSDWDDRARQDAAHYIATSYRHDWSDYARFYEEGGQEALRLIRPILKRFDVDPHGRRIVDIGCGIGRLFSGFVSLGFSEIWGVDVSPEMLKKGEHFCPVPGVRFILVSGRDLRPLGDASFDYCFSYVVFQHLPHQSIVWSYLDEIWRVLAPGGICQVHFRGRYRLVQRVFRVLPQPVRHTVRSARQFMTRRISIQPESPADPVGTIQTWSGAAVPPERMEQHLIHRGFVDVAIVPDAGREPPRPTGLYWALGRKPPLAVA